jgi:hypothetical protein
MTTLDDPKPAGPEQRTGERQRVLLAGKLVYGDADLTLDCGIRNLSRRGARVRLNGAQALPNEVHLIELRNGKAFDCIVTWRRTPEFGLKFIKSYELPETVADEQKTMSKLKRIWVENAAR